MNPILDLEKSLKFKIPGSLITISTPRWPNGIWILDIDANQTKVVIEWYPSSNQFDVTDNTDYATERPPISCLTVEEVEQKVVEICQ